MDFGIPKQRRKKVEFHSELPVLRVLAVVAGKNSRKFVFNSKAADMLGFGVEKEERVSLSFENGLYVANTTTLETEQYRVTTNKPYSFSNKKVHEYLVKNGLDITIDTDYVLTNVSADMGVDYQVAELSELMEGDSHNIDASQIMSDNADIAVEMEEEEELPQLLAVEENHVDDSNDSEDSSSNW